ILGGGVESATLPCKGYCIPCELFGRRIKSRPHSRASLRGLHTRKKVVKFSAHCVKPRLRGTRQLLVLRHRNDGSLRSLVHGDEYHATLHDRFEHLAHLVLCFCSCNFDRFACITPSNQRIRCRPSRPFQTNRMPNRTLEELATDRLDQRKRSKLCRLNRNLVALL